MKAVIVTFLTYLCVALATDEYERMVNTTSRLFAIPKEETEKCVEKTHVVLNDLRLFEETFDKSVEDTTNQDSMRRAECFLTCCAQAKGLMKGAKFQMVKIHELLETFKIPAEGKELLHTAVNECARDTQDIDDECKAGRTFITCVTEKVNDSPPRLT